MIKCNVCSIRYCVAMTHCYSHLIAEDRAAIMMVRATYSIRSIASHLCRSPSTVSRVDPFNG